MFLLIVTVKLDCWFVVDMVISLASTKPWQLVSVCQTGLCLCSV